MRISPAAAADPSVPCEERLAVGAREEAEVLRVALARHGEPRLGGDLAHLALLQLAEREAQAAQRVRRETGEHVALVLGEVRGCHQQRLGAGAVHARVVARGERVRAEPRAELEHRVEAHVAVAADAGVGREARGVLGEPAVHHARAELRAQVDREMWHAETVREAPRGAHGLRGAAALLAVVLRVGPQLERTAHRLVPFARDEQRGDRAVHAAAHRDERAARGLLDGGLASGRAERAVQRIGGELGGVHLRGQQPAQLLGDLLGADPRGVEQWAAADQRDGGRARGLGCAAAARVEARLVDLTPGALCAGGERERDPDQIAAGRATRGARVGARGDRARAPAGARGGS